MYIPGSGPHAVVSRDCEDHSTGVRVQVWCDSTALPVPLGKLLCQCHWVSCSGVTACATYYSQYLVSRDSPSDGRYDHCRSGHIDLADTNFDHQSMQSMLCATAISLTGAEATAVSGNCPSGQCVHCAVSLHRRFGVILGLPQSPSLPRVICFHLDLLRFASYQHHSSDHQNIRRLSIHRINPLSSPPRKVVEEAHRQWSLTTHCVRS